MGYYKCLLTFIEYCLNTVIEFSVFSNTVGLKRIYVNEVVDVALFSVYVSLYLKTYFLQDLELKVRYLELFHS